MKIESKIRSLEKKIIKTGAEVYFWDSVADFEQAQRDNKVSGNAIHFIDDITE